MTRLTHLTHRCLLALALLGALGLAQTRPQPTSQTPPNAARPAPPILPADLDKSADTTTPLNSPIKMLKYQHEEVKKEVEKLVKMVSEVQDEVEKAGENVLPLNTLKKLDDIEKQARKVRGRLKQ